MLTLADIIESFTGWWPTHVTQPIGHVVIDSRQAQPGDLFVALKGERADGHAFVHDAFSRGAVAALVERDMPVEGDVIDLHQGVTVTQVSLPVCLRVDDALAALQDL